MIKALIGVLAFALLTIALIAGGRWTGQLISLSGYSKSTRVLDIKIGQDVLHLSENLIRFATQRRSGEAERVDIALTWPKMEGYSQYNRADFNDLSKNARLIFLQINESTMSHDMAGRLKPIYSQLVSNTPTAFDFGLTLYHFNEEAGYGQEVLLTSASGDYAVRCVLPESADKATSGDCQSDVKIGNDLSVLYRFSSQRLSEWKQIDEAVRQFVRDRLSS